MLRGNREILELIILIILQKLFGKKLYTDLDCESFILAKEVLKRIYFSYQ